MLSRNPSLEACGGGRVGECMGVRGEEEMVDCKRRLESKMQWE